MQQRLCGKEQEFGVLISPSFQFKSAGGESVLNAEDKAFEDWQTSHLLKVLFKVAEVVGKNPIHSLSGFWLGNGSLFYIDQNQTMEIATAEYLAGSLDGLRQEKATEAILSEAADLFAAANNLERVHFYKNNVGPAGLSLYQELTYGTHQNYTYSVGDWSKIAFLLPSFISTNLFFTGNGHVGQDAFGKVGYFLSQRAAHVLHEYAGISNGRAIINRKNEFEFSPNLESDFARLHFTSSDATRCEFQTWLVDGMNHLVIRFAEEGGQWDPACLVRRPVEELARINRSLSLGRDYQVHCADCEVPIFDYSQMFLNEVKQLNPLSPEEKKIIEEWQRVLDVLRTGAFDKLVGELDWATKQFVIEKAMVRHSFGWNSVRAWKMDFEYHNIHPSPRQSLFARLEERGLIRHLIAPDEIVSAKQLPPQNTRAKNRGEFIKFCQRQPEPFRRKVCQMGWDGVTINGYSRRVYFSSQNNPLDFHSETLEEFYKNYSFS